MGRPKSINSKTKCWCAVPGCFSDSRKTNLEKYPWMEGVVFEPFPTKKGDPRLRAKWLSLIRRPLDYDPKPWHRVCSRHFVDGKKSEKHSLPEFFPWNQHKDTNTTRSDSSIKKRATPPHHDDDDNHDHDKQTKKKRQHLSPESPVEDLSLWGNISITDDHDVSCTALVPKLPLAVNHVEVTTATELTEYFQHAEHSYSRCNDGAKYIQPPLTAEIGVQTELSGDDIQGLQREVENLTKTLDNEDTLLRDMFVAKVTDNDKSISKYTGVPNLAIFNEIVSITNEYEPKLKYWIGKDSLQEKHYQRNGKKPGPTRKLTRKHELIMTLIRFRVALPLFVLSNLFGVSVSRVSSVFNTWMFYLSVIFEDQVLWPSKHLIQKHMPPSFKKAFPRTRCIIDCTEIFIQRPRDPSVQAKTYSSYKSHNTYKFLVAITPTGAISYVSKIWGGNTSDRYITENSGFLDLISPGDEVMADRGFTIRDLLTERHAYLTIPLFTRKCPWGKGKRLNANEIRKTRRIANLRIHVERAIQRLKTFKLLSQVIPWSMKSVVYPMVVVGSFICNLMKPLVNK